MINNCPICGKAFDVLWPHLWRYKRERFYLCSWKCVRLYDGKGKEERPVKETSEKKRVRMNPDDMAEAVRMFKTGDSGLEQYLTEHGITNVSKWKSNAKVRFGKPGITPATLKVDGPLRIETPEAKQVEVVETPALTMAPVPEPIKNINIPFIATTMEYKTTGISTPIGDWQYFRKQGYLDWTPLDGNGPVSMNLEEWKELQKLFPEVLKVLGVKLDG